MPDPELGVPLKGSAAIAACQAANPLMIQAFLFFNVITPYFFPLSYLRLGLLAMRRSPWLSTVSIACGLAGALPWGIFVGQEATAHIIAQRG